MRNLSVIVMTVIGEAPRDWLERLDDVFPMPPGFSWRSVPESPLPIQLRSILRVNACAVAVWVGADDAVDRAAELIERLLKAGPPVVIAIAEVHDPSTESALRQAGAIYLCAYEAQERLCDVLESILDPKEIKMDDS